MTTAIGGGFLSLNKEGRNIVNNIFFSTNPPEPINKSDFVINLLKN
jgi:hypothetical protein